MWSWFWGNIYDKKDDDIVNIVYYGDDTKCQLNLENWKYMQISEVPLGRNIQEHMDNIYSDCNNNVELIALSMRNNVLKVLEKLKERIHKYCPEKILLIFNRNKILYQINDTNINNKIILVIQLYQ